MEEPEHSQTDTRSSQWEVESELKLETILSLKEMILEQNQKIASLEKKQQLSSSFRKGKPAAFVDLEAGFNAGGGALQENSDDNNDNESMDVSSSVNRSSRSLVFKKISTRDEDGLELHDDVYSILFLADFPSHAFLFSFLVFCLKCALFSFIAVDLFFHENDETGFFAEKTNLVRAAQFFMLPVAVAIQDDLISSYDNIANMKYDPIILESCPGATKFKFELSIACQLIDGLFSLTVNIVLLLQSTEVIDLFLNFAALHFLQSIDNVAFRLADEGFFTEDLEMVVFEVKTINLPAKSNRFTTKLDTVLYLGTYAAVLAAWIAITV